MAKNVVVLGTQWGYYAFTAAKTLALIICIVAPLNLRWHFT